MKETFVKLIYFLKLYAINYKFSKEWKDKDKTAKMKVYLSEILEKKIQQNGSFVVQVNNK